MYTFKVKNVGDIKYYRSTTTIPTFIFDCDVFIDPKTNSVYTDKEVFRNGAYVAQKIRVNPKYRIIVLNKTENYEK